MFGDRLMLECPVLTCWEANALPFFVAKSEDF